MKKPSSAANSLLVWAAMNMSRFGIPALGKNVYPYLARASLPKPANSELQREIAEWNEKVEKRKAEKAPFRYGKQRNKGK